MKQRLDAAINDFLESRALEDKARNTMMNDRKDLGKLLRDIGSNVFVENITERHITESLTISRRTNSPRSMASIQTTYNVFFAWCVRAKRMPKSCDPMAGRKAPKWHEEERRRIPVTMFPTILDNAHCERDRILFSSALNTLSRAGEITNWRIGDLDLAGRRLATRVFKSKKDDRKPISKGLDRDLRRWLLAYQDECGPLQDHWYLIPGKTPGRFAKGHSGFPAVYDNGSSVLMPEKRFARPSLCAKYVLKSIGFPTTGEGMHTFRRSAARARFDALRDAGYDGAMEEVQGMLNHKYASMTERYIGVTLSRIRRDENIAGEEMFPQIAPQQDVIRLADHRDAQVPTNDYDLEGSAF
jgi:integrase